MTTNPHSPTLFHITTLEQSTRHFTTTTVKTASGECIKSSLGRRTHGLTCHSGVRGGEGGVRTGLSIFPLVEIRTSRWSQRVWHLGVSVGRVRACALLPRPPTLSTLSRPGRCSTYCLFYTTFLRAVSPVGPFERFLYPLIVREIC